MDGNFMLCETCKKMILVGHGSKLLIKRNKTFRFCSKKCRSKIFRKHFSK